MPPRRQAAPLPTALRDVVGARTAVLSKSLALLQSDLSRLPGHLQEERTRELDKAAVMLAKALAAHRDKGTMTPAARLVRIKTVYPGWTLEQGANKLTARKRGTDGKMIVVEAGSVVELEHKLGKVKE